jgi:hypothetical protein
LTSWCTVKWRRLATFDFLWVAADATNTTGCSRKMTEGRRVCSGHACERKETMILPTV